MSDPSSPIIDFYPIGMLILQSRIYQILLQPSANYNPSLHVYSADFEVDMNGKRFSWQVH